MTGSSYTLGGGINQRYLCKEKNLMKYNIASLLFIILIGASCSSSKKTTTTGTDDGMISINFVQINDVYEIAPLNGGKDGGMARVATIKKKYLRENSNTYLVMAGDFLSPSVYNSLPYEGKAIRGRQMVEAMNAAGMDIAVFGNHEFDIKEAELQARINESHFDWISSNSFHKQGENISAFEKNKNPIPESWIKTYTDADGTTFKVGFIGLNIPFTKNAYVTYTDPLAAAKKLYALLKDSVDAVVAITHQAIQDDEILAKEIPGLALIIGGHEHDQRFEKIGGIFITKAMANAKSAYILKMTFNKRKHKVSVTATLEVLDENVPLDSTTNAVVQKWGNIANNSYAALGFDAGKIVMTNGEPLDGRETEIRSHATNLTKMIVKAMQFASKQADVVIMNAGSIRVDDVLQMPVTQYDILRTLPFGGGVKEVDMKGSLLVQILDAGLKNYRIGGYLHYNENLHRDDASAKWLLNGTAIDDIKIYHVAITEFMLTGGEANLGFVKPDNPAITKVYELPALDIRSDIRKVILYYLEKGR